MFELPVRMVDGKSRFKGPFGPLVLAGQAFSAGGSSRRSRLTPPYNAMPSHLPE